MTATDEAGRSGPDGDRLLVTVGSVRLALVSGVIRFWRCVLAEDLQEERGLEPLLLGESCWHKSNVPG